MGTQKTVDDLMQKETKFKEAVEQEQKTMDSTMKPFTETFDPFVASFYKGNNWTPLKLGSGFQRDLQSQAEFSLDSITKAITRIAEDVLAGNLLSVVNPPGATLSATTEATEANRKQAAGSLSGLPVAKDIFVGAAVACISEVMGWFSTRADGTIAESKQQHQIAPGLMLHAYGYSSMNSVETVVQHASLLMSATGYALIYSFQQAAAEQGMKWMATMAAQLEQSERSLLKLHQTLLEAEEDPNTSGEVIENLKQRHDSLSEEIQKEKAEVEKEVKKYEKNN
ncbi:MAG TPA: hypothetical protein VGI76_02390 [Solirubrobacteraceae bacterium]|jgi:hypothetical protein